jgi:endonuclease/exonuclease/phosphatase family metal-dependent hydrolase
MNLTVLTWNVRRAKQESKVWNIISMLDPDIITLQEVVGIPDNIKDAYCIHSKKATSKTGKEQIFSTVILAKGSISELALKSELVWVNKELDFFKGNIVGSLVEIPGHLPINVISVYSPAWPVDHNRLIDIDTSNIKLKQNPQVWCTEILWAALKDIKALREKAWVVAGDFNSSVTFDYLWKGGPRGNQEIIDRLNALGLTECLKNYNGVLTPTFRNPKGGKVIHQLDHMYVTRCLDSGLLKSYVCDSYSIFEESISDHLPIISEFDYKVKS